MTALLGVVSFEGAPLDRPTISDGLLGSGDVIEWAGVTKRILANIVDCFPGLPTRRGSGSGTPLRWTPAEAQQLSVIARCRALGAPHAAQQAAADALVRWPQVRTLVIGSAGGCAAFAGDEPVSVEADFTGWVVAVPAPPVVATASPEADEVDGEYPPQPCPEDPEGMHFPCCGCEW